MDYPFTIHHNLKPPGEEWEDLLVKSPSNIALVKYWGKHGNQLPSNPSLSITLRHSVTELRLFWKKRNPEHEHGLELLFEGAPRPSFEGRILRYLKTVTPFMPWLKDLSLRVETHNSFPHSAGIASSASAMSAMALALCRLEQELLPEQPEEDDLLPKASFLARLGSGSACRSVYPGYTCWGEHMDVPGSSDLFAVPLNHRIHKDFSGIHDSILIVSSSAKKVSSTEGHELMHRHPYREQRFIQARENIHILLSALETGDWETFIRINENEALTLHGLMLSSDPSFILLHPHTLDIIDRVREARGEKGWKICFTMDAGPNIHLLYPASIRDGVQDFIHRELLQYCENASWIDDTAGNGPEY